MPTTTPDIEHPHWCHPDHCTARPRPTDDTANRGRHLSRPVTDVPGQRIRVQILQEMAPWKTETFIVITDEIAATHNPDTAPIHILAGDLIGVMVALLGGIHVDACTAPHHDEGPHSYLTGDMLLWCPGPGGDS